MHKRSLSFSRSAGCLDVFVTLAAIVVMLNSVSALAQRPLGTDVSQFQGVIDWNQYATARQFAIIRATHGTIQDTKFLQNITGAINAGVIAGCYHYAVPVYDYDNGIPGADPETEAYRFVTFAGDYIKPGYLRPMLDLELGGGQVPVGATNLSNWANAWIESVRQKTGVEAMVYCSSNYARNYLNSTLASRTLWLANWTCPSNPQTASPPFGSLGIWSNWAFWQYTNGVNCYDYVPGINARVDLDVFNGTLSQLQSNYVIGRPALISHAPTSLSHAASQGVNAGSQTFTIRNTGTGTLLYDVTTNVTWLSVKPGHGDCMAETDTITINYNTANLGVGTFNGKITISSIFATNSPQTINVTLTVRPLTIDLNNDGFIDRNDFSIFYGCMTGSDLVPAGSGCTESDLDSDGDVDQSDFGILQRCLSGNGIPPDPQCAS